MIDFNIRNYVKSLVPPGKYTVRIKISELKATKETLNGRDNSKFLQVGFEIVSAFLSGQMLFDNMNIYHSKEQVATIGRERLAQLCDVIGLLEMDNTHQLIGKILDVDVVNEFDNRGNQVARITKFIKPLGEIASKQQTTVDDGYAQLMQGFNDERA